MFLSLCLFTTNFNLLKINLFNYKHNNFPIDALQLKKANAIDEIIVTTTTNNSKIINTTDTKDNEKNMISNSFKEEIGSEKKNSNKDIINQKGVTEDDDDDILILNNKSIENTSLSTTTPTTKSFNRIEIFNFAAAGDWACTSKAKDTVKNIIDHEAELVLALGDLSYDSGAKCWLKIIKPIAEKTKIVIGNHEADSSKKLKII